MAESEDQPDTVDFNVESPSSSKQPRQLVALLERTLRQEFPGALDVIEIAHPPDTRVISLKNLDKLEPDTAKSLAQRARAVFNDFMNSPWY